MLENLYFANTLNNKPFSTVYIDMSLFKLLFILFLTVPLLEIYILIQVAGFIGPLPTILVCIFTAALGAFLLRLQGLQTLASAQLKLQQGEIPATDLLGGLILLLSGVLLLTPGFFTDTIGFLCLIPAFRNYVALGILRSHLQTHVYRSKDETVIVEGEFWEDNERKRLNDKNQ